MLTRERDRMQMTLVKANKSLSKFVKFLLIVPDRCFRNVITDYYIKCNHAHDTIFKDWRQKVLDLEEKGYADLYDGWHYPYLKSRVVENWEQLNVAGVPMLTETLLDQQKLVTEIMLSKYEYNMLTNTSNKDARTAQTLMPRIVPSHLRKANTSQNRNHNTSGLSSDDSKSTKMMIAFPEKPAQRFIPSTAVSH